MRSACALAVLPLLVACSTAADAPSDAGPDADAGVITCRADPRAETYAAGMSKPGRSGLLTFTLVEGRPAPPARGTNVWTLKIASAAGSPTLGATISVVPFMPAHGHGSGVTPELVEVGAGVYRASAIDLFMPGLWQVTIRAQAGGVDDAAELTFCVEG